MSRRAAEVAADESLRLLERTPKSRALYERAVVHMPFGVGSSFQAGDPYPIYIEQGMGARLWDVDRNEYVDFHGGFGCNVVGHAHPKIVEAIDRAARTGTHFAATTEVSVALRRGAVPALRAREGAVRELGYRGDHGRDPHRARARPAATTS